MNGDGVVDMISANGGTDSFGVLLGNTDGLFEDEVQYITNGEAWMEDCHAYDFNADGVNDILGHYTQELDLVQPAINPESVVQHLSDLPAATVELAEGINEFEVGQAVQELDQVTLNVVIESVTEPAGSVKLDFFAPDGTQVVTDLDIGSASFDKFPPSPHTLQSYRLVIEQAIKLSHEGGSLNPVQPKGGWVLQIENNLGQSVELIDFTVITKGFVGGARRGDRIYFAESIVMPTAPSAKVVHGTTLGYSDKGTVSCTGTENSPDRYYDLTLLSNTSNLTVKAVATFDSVLELRSGSCDSGGSILNCNDNKYVFAKKNPKLTQEKLLAGDYCIVIDGKNTGIQQGEYDLFIEMEN